MRKYILLFFSFVLIAGCSKDEATAPVQAENTVYGFVRGEINGSSWYADKITLVERNNIKYIKATKNIFDNPTYSSSEINFRLINISQPVVYAIGENEPGYVYAVKADYILKAKNGADKVLKAYYLEYSQMDISRINDKSLEAEFIFKAYDEFFTDSVEIVNGKINLDF